MGNIFFSKLFMQCLAALGAVTVMGVVFQQLYGQGPEGMPDSQLADMCAAMTMVYAALIVVATVGRAIRMALSSIWKRLKRPPSAAI